VRAGTLTGEQLAALPDDELRSAYSSGDLYVSETTAGALWTVNRAGTWLFGPVLGPAFYDAVLAGWQVVLPQPGDWWA
jgi:hypothetical protein